MPHTGRPIVHTLPSELLLGVLEIGHFIDEDERKSYFGHPGDERAEPTDDGEPPPIHPFLITFSGTCRRWRDMTMSPTPYLWSAIIGRYTLDLTELALERSGSLPIDLYFGSGVECPRPQDLLIF